MNLWKNPWFTYAAVMLGVCGHASSEVVAKMCHISGPELSVWRFGLGGVGLIILSLLTPANRNLLEPFKTHGLRMTWLSISGLSVGYLAFHWSLDFASATQVAVVVTTIPIWVGLVNLMINKQPFGTAKIITGIAALLGVALLATEGALATLTGAGESLFGVLLAMTCSSVVAVYTVMVRPIIAQYGAMRITAVTTAIGAVGLWLLAGLFFGDWVDPTSLFDRPGEHLAALLILGFWNTTIAQFLWIGGLAHVPDITRGSYLFFLKPVIAAFLAVLFLGDAITAWQYLAIFVICASVFIEANWNKFSRSA
jgi:drug/metabolite transporter (DMT)-like permease